MKKIKKLLLLPLIIIMNISCIGKMSVMTYNIRYNSPNDGENKWEYRKEEVVDLIENYNPDFIGIQEAMPAQLDFLNEHLKSFSYIGHGRDGINTRSEVIPIFFKKNKFNLVESEVLWLSPTPHKVSKGWDAALNRIVVYGLFEENKTGELLHIFNTHFDHRGRLSRIRSAEFLIKQIQKKEIENEKIILMGDLNCYPNQEPIEILSALLEDSFNESRYPTYGPMGTFNGFDTIRVFKARIDYIFTKNIKVKNYRCIDDRRQNGRYPSDHLPVLIEL